MIKTLLSTSAMIAIVAACGPAFGQAGGTVLIENIDVDSRTGGGTNNPPTFDAQERRFMRRPGAETVVSITQQDAGNKANLREVLEQTPGVNFTERGENSLGTMSMRGSDITQTGQRSGRGVRAFIDGIPVGRVETGVTTQVMDVNAADYLEVYRGANSLRYGALATGGAINLVSKTGLSAPGFGISGSVGSYGNRKEQIEFGGSKDRFDWYVQSNEYYDGGYENHSRNDARRFSGNFGWRPNDNIESRTYIASGTNLQSLPTSVPLNQIETFRRSGYDPTGASFPYNQRADFDYQRIANKTVFRFGTTTFEISPYLLRTGFDHVPNARSGIVDNTWTDIGTYLRLENKSQVGSIPAEFIVGYRPTYETADNKRWQWLPGSEANDKYRQVYNDAFKSWLHESHAEAAFGIFPSVKTFFGVQAFWTNRILTDEYSGPTIASSILGPASSNGRRNYDREFAAMNPKFGANWEFSKNHFLFANISRSSEAPNSGDISTLLTIEQTVNGFNNPNVQLALIDKLHMQTAWTAELGVRGGWERFQYDVTIYNMQIKDEILSQCALGLIPLNSLTVGQRTQVRGQFACNLSGSLVPFNAGKTIHDGVETGFKSIPFVDVFTSSDKVFFNAVWNYTDFRFDGDPAYGDNRLPVIPRHQVFGELGYRHPAGFYISGNARFVSERLTVFDGSGGSDFVIPSYVLFGAKIGWKAPDNSWSLWAEARNLTDVAYAGDFVPLLRASDAVSPAGTPSVYPGTGRALYAGFTKRFN